MRCYEIKKDLAYEHLIQYAMDARNYREIKKKIQELKALDNKESRLKERRKYAMWKTRYGFDVVKYIEEHLDEDLDDVVMNALKIVDEYRLRGGIDDELD